MMKNKSIFLKSTLILLFGSLVTKSLGFIIRVVFTRMIGEGAISLYGIIMPTYSLVISLTQLGLPVAVSTLVARETKSGRKIVYSILPIIIILNLIMILLLVFGAKYISNNLLNVETAYYPIICIAAVLPFISVSSILRGYFFGKQKMLPHTMSNIIEQLTRLIVMVVFLPKFIADGDTKAVCAFILLSIISEFVSIIVFLLYLPKGFKIHIKDLKPDLSTTREVLSLCLPTVGGRLFGNLAYFFEPVILIYILKTVGYSVEYITNQYGVYNAYVIPLLVIPSFIIQSISTALVPEISKSYQTRNIKNIRRKLKKSLLVCLLLGVICNTFVFIFARPLLRLVYNTQSGLNYVRTLALFFILYNFEGPLASSLQALGKSNLAFRSTTIGIIIKLIVMSLISFMRVGIYGLIISEIVNIIFVVLLDYIFLNKEIQKI